VADMSARSSAVSTMLIWVREVELPRLSAFTCRVIDAGRKIVCSREVVTEPHGRFSLCRAVEESHQEARLDAQVREHFSVTPTANPTWSLEVESGNSIGDTNPLASQSTADDVCIDFVNAQT